MNERQRVLAAHMLSALPRLLGMRTLASTTVESGMTAKVVGAASSRSRFCFV